MKKSVLILIALLLIAQTLDAQDLAYRPLQKLIDCPNAGGPEHLSYDFGLRAYPNGGLLFGFDVGLFEKFTLGISYGGTKVIGYGQPDWNPQPGVLAQFRFLDETVTTPALSVGFWNQGFGAYIDSTEQYLYKSKGFYATGGKNFTLGQMGEFGAHLGVNQNPVEGDDHRLDFWAACDYRPSYQIGFVLEYTAGINDQGREESHGKNRGFLHAGVRWSFAKQMAVDVIFRDIFSNQKEELRKGSDIGREIRVSYVEHF